MATRPEISLDFDRHEVFVGEPLRVVIGLANTSSESLRISNNALVDAQFTFTNTESGASIVATDNPIGVRLIGNDLEVLPGQLIASDKTLAFALRDGRRQPLFKLPGTYACTATVRCGPRTIKSKETRIQVLAMPNPVIELLERLPPSSRTHALSNRMVDEEIAATIETILSELRQARISDHLRYSLADYYLRTANRERSAQRRGRENTDRPDVMRALKAFWAFDGVSEEIPNLKARAVLKQVTILTSWAPLRETVGVDNTLRQIRLRFPDDDDRGLGVSTLAVPDLAKFREYLERFE